MLLECLLSGLMFVDLCRDLQVLHLQGHIYMPESQATVGQELLRHPRQGEPVSDTFAHLCVLSLTRGWPVRRDTMWHTKPAGVCCHNLAGCILVPARSGGRPCQA